MFSIAKLTRHPTSTHQRADLLAYDKKTMRRLTMQAISQCVKMAIDAGNRSKRQSKSANRQEGAAVQEDKQMWETKQNE